MNIYDIRDMALKSKRAVYSAQQLANLIGKPKPVATVYLSRLVRKGLAKRLLRGRISFVEDDYVVASQLVEPSYISLSSALAFHGLLAQVPARIECVTPGNSRRYKRLGITYHKIPASFFYGYERHWKGSSYVLVAEPEKALLDALYLNRISESTARELLGKLNRERLTAYVARFHGKGKKKLERWLQ